MQQEVVLTLLAKEPPQGYQLRARLEEALGALGEGLNAGHICVTLGRLSEVSWPRPDLAEFHLKLVAAAQAGLADPVSIVDAQRREMLRRLRDAQRAALQEPDHSNAALLLEGVVLRLQPDLRWLEACERSWAGRGDRS
jgi:hypothetical protein